MLVVLIDNFTTASVETLLGYMDSDLRSVTNFDTDGDQKAILNSSLDALMQFYASKQGGVYNNTIIPQALESGFIFNSEIDDYIESIQESLCALIAQGEICLDKSIGFTLENISQPNFGLDFDGLHAQLGGTQGSAIFIDENGNIAVNLYDTFGVDLRSDALPEDFTTSAFYTITGGNKGLMAFYVLQHVHGHPALTHKVPIDFSTLGLEQININNCD